MSCAEIQDAASQMANAAEMFSGQPSIPPGVQSFDISGRQGLVQELIKHHSELIATAGREYSGRLDASLSSLAQKIADQMKKQEFAVRKLPDTKASGTYSSLMAKACDAVGMKPVCDHPSYCKTDKNAVYIGQTHHLAHGGHRGTSSCVAGSCFCFRSM